MSAGVLNDHALRRLLDAGRSVVSARTVEEQRLRGAMRAAEAERKRWARELEISSSPDGTAVTAASPAP